MIEPGDFDMIRFEASAGRAAKLLKALANERRLRLLCRLVDGERSVGQLRPAAGLSQSALSQHLAVLREEGVVATRREGLTVWYRIENPAALQVVAALAEVFCPSPQPENGQLENGQLEHGRLENVLLETVQGET